MYAAAPLFLHATHQAIITGIFIGVAFAQHHLDMSIVKVAGGHAGACCNYVRDFVQVLSWGQIVNAAGQRGLVQLYLAHSVHDEVSQFVHAVAAVALDAVGTHVDERHIADKIFCGGAWGVPDHFGAFEHKAGE